VKVFVSVPRRKIQTPIGLIIVSRITGLTFDLSEIMGFHYVNFILLVDMRWLPQERSKGRKAQILYLAKKRACLTDVLEHSQEQNSSMQGTNSIILTPADKIAALKDR
jgi:hypothetical protein